nr:derriere protein-like [Leptinotarsa decemlineata]
MKAAFILFAIFELSLLQNVTNNSGRKYYFKMGKNNSEVRVHNRIHYLNHNITDYEYPNRRGGATNFLNFEEKKTTILPQYLDEEWNYQHKNQSKNNLPKFIQKFYERASEEQTSSNVNTRILFNTNRNSSSGILFFNLDSVDANENILDADLYFYWPLKNTSSIHRESVVLRLYQLESQFDEDLNETNSIQNPDVHKLFNVIYVSKAQKGWQIFKVKKPIDNWLTGEENLGLILTISSYDDNKLVEIFKDSNEGMFRTFIAIKVQNNSTLSDVTEQFPTKASEISAECQRKEWVVNFRNLGWDQFIITPDSFLANDCSGKCLKPKLEDKNHVKLLHIFQKRSLCCVPVKYRSQPIMYFDKFDNIAIKNYDNIIATECGCR